MGQSVTIILKRTQVSPVYRSVRKWGDPIMVANYGRDVNLIGTTNFQVIQLYVPGKKTWSAVQNHVDLGRVEMDYLIALNSRYGSGGTLNERMNWLVYEGTGHRPYWGGNWDTGTAFQYGTMLWGGQKIQIDQVKTFTTSTPHNSTIRDIPMGRVKMFTRADFAQTLQGKVTPLTHPDLIPQCSSAGNDNFYNPTPNGFTMFSPLWGPEWGVNMGSEWYIPLECLE